MKLANILTILSLACVAASEPEGNNNNTEEGDFEYVLFKLLDKNNNNKICKPELGILVNIDEFELNAEDIDQIMDEFDKNKDGQLDWQEFLEMMMDV